MGCHGSRAVAVEPNGRGIVTKKTTVTVGSAHADSASGSRGLDVLGAVQRRGAEVMEGMQMSEVHSVPERLSVPCDLYGLCILEPLQLDVQADGMLIVCLEVIRTLAFAVVNLLVQVMYVLRIHKLNRQREGDQCRQLPYLQLVCVFVFSTSIFQELRASVNLTTLIWRAPVTCTDTDGTTYASLSATLGSGGDNNHRRGAVLSHGGSRSWKAKLRHWTRRQSSVDFTWNLSNITMPWKVICLAFVVMPRFILDVLLTFVASMYIIRSPEEAMILNTVAVLFITDIDTFIYNAFTTNAVKEQMCSAAEVEFYPTNLESVFAFVVVNFVYPLTIISSTFFLVFHARRECGSGISGDLLTSLSVGDFWH